MKKQYWIGLIITGFIAWTTGVASATTINFNSTHDATNRTSSYTGFDDFQLETFDYADLGAMQVSGLDNSLWVWTGQGSIMNGTGAGYSAPFGDSARDETNYLAVPNPTEAGSITADLTSTGKTYDYFGLWWGSLDWYNSITFYLNGQETESFVGRDISLGGTDGSNQEIDEKNRYVNFMDLQEYDSFTLTSGEQAFEVDNIAIGNRAPVPEPATLFLFGTGLLGLAGSRLRNKKS